MGNAAEQQGPRLRQARIARGFDTIEAACSRFGFKQSSYTQHENGTRGLRMKTAQQYASAYKVTASWLLTGEGTGLQHGVGKAIQGSIPITGFVEAGRWFPVEDDVRVPEGATVPIVADYPAEWQRAFVVQGSSINRVARPGEVIVCLDLGKSGSDFKEHDLVVIERSKFGGMMIERTAKRVRRTRAGWELWPDSDDPAHQQPLVLNVAEEHEEYRVGWRVLWIMRKP